MSGGISEEEFDRREDEILDLLEEFDRGQPDERSEQMTPGMKIAAAVVGGYVLGRRKKAKLAITMGAWLVGRKLNLDPKKLLSDVTRELASSPELAGVRDQVRDEVLGAGKTLAADILAHQAGRLAGSLQEHTDSLRDKAAGLPAAVMVGATTPKRTRTTTSPTTPTTAKTRAKPGPAPANVRRNRAPRKGSANRRARRPAVRRVRPRGSGRPREAVRRSVPPARRG